MRNKDIAIASIVTASIAGAVAARSVAVPAQLASDW